MQMGKWFEAAKDVRRTMDAAGAMLTDQEASRVVALYPSMRFDGELIPAGTRIQWDGQIRRAAVDLWDRPENAPGAAPNLWSDIGYREGARVIPEVITAALAFAKGETGWWQGTVYESLLDDNVWNPAQHSAGWRSLS